MTDTGTGIAMDTETGIATGIATDTETGIATDTATATDTAIAWGSRCRARSRNRRTMRLQQVLHITEG